MTIQDRLENLIRGNPQSVQAYLREVCKSEPVENTRADMHIYMLRLDGNNRPRTNDFVDFLVNRIVDYCIPPSEIRKAKEKMQNITRFSIHRNCSERLNGYLLI